MKLLPFLLLLACATTPYRETEECPSHMTQSEHASGAVRCRAECSSWGRDFEDYRLDCACVCKPKHVFQNKVAAR